MTDGEFTFLPRGAADGADEDPQISVVRLRAHEYAGPFWDDEGHLSDDFDELHRWIGISRALYEDAMAWIDALGSRPAADHDRERDDLVRRLRREVHRDVMVAD